MHLACSPVSALPAQASRRHATVEEVDDEDAGPITPPRRHVTFNTTLNPPSPDLPSEKDSHSIPSSPSHEDFTDEVFNNSPSPSRPHTPDSPPTHAPSTPHTPHTPTHHMQNLQTPRRNHGRSDHTPRTGRHSTCRQTSGPAGNKKEHKATDVWPFFSKEGNKHQCNFCLYVFRFPFILIINYYLAELRNALTQNAKSQALAPLLQLARYDIICALIT